MQGLTTIKKSILIFCVCNAFLAGVFFGLIAIFFITMVNVTEKKIKQHIPTKPLF